MLGFTSPTLLPSSLRFDLEITVRLRTLILSFMLAVTLPTLGQEPDNRTPLERYEADSKSTLYLCKLTFKLALIKSDGGQAQDEKSDWAACIRNGKTTAKARFDKALLTVKKSKAKEALKTYQVAYMAAIDGINPGSDMPPTKARG